MSPLTTGGVPGPLIEEVTDRGFCGGGGGVNDDDDDDELLGSIMHS